MCQGFTAQLILMSNSDSITHIYIYNNESNLLDAQRKRCQQLSTAWLHPLSVVVSLQAADRQHTNVWWLITSISVALKHCSTSLLKCLEDRWVSIWTSFNLSWVKEEINSWLVRNLELFSFFLFLNEHMWDMPLWVEQKVLPMNNLSDILTKAKQLILPLTVALWNLVDCLV